MSKHEKYENISSSSKPKGMKDGGKYFFNKIEIFFLRNRKRNLKALLSVVICLFLIVAALGGTYLRKVLSLINYNDGIAGDPDATFAEEESEENLSFETMYDISTADSVKDLIKAWSQNGGEKLYSKKVINVLLIGEDSDDGSHRSDSMILASINTSTKKITLCSFLRDSYSYININGSDRFDKTNHSYSWGGPQKLMEVLSDNYKIKIDHYVSINFQSFVKAIDLLGGVSVPITEKEAAFMNRTTRVKGFEAGDNVLLNGQRALIYARIRYLDSEVERTRRQRNVISSVIKNVKASSLSDLNKVIETFLPYITTNYKTSEILSLGTQGLSDGWLSYEICGMVEPSEEFRWGVSGFRTYTGYLDVWVVDYIKAARELQLALYGKTNIQINPTTHVSAIDMVKGGTGYESNRGGDSTEITFDSTVETESVYQEETTSKRRGLFDTWTTEKDDSTTREKFTVDFSGVFGSSEESSVSETDSYSESSSYLESTVNVNE